MLCLLNAQELGKKVKLFALKKYTNVENIFHIFVIFLQYISENTL